MANPSHDKGNVAAHAPRVEACIQDAMAKYAGGSPKRDLTYYQNVHQDLAPLARELENALSIANARIAELERATPPSPSTGPRKFHVKDHVVREVVNSLRDTALEFHGHQSLRERLAAALDPLLQSPSTAPNSPEFEGISQVPSTAPEVDERAAFEAWARDPIRAEKLPLDRWPTNDGYKDTRTYIAFYGWKSGRAALASRPAVAEQAYDLAEAAGFSIQYLDGKHAFTGGIEQVERLLASRPAEVGDDGLPPLPEAWHGFRFNSGWNTWEQVSHWAKGDDDVTPAYTAEQYRQGQRDAVAADRAREWFVVGGRRIGRTYMAKLAHDAARYRWLRESNNVEAVSILDMHSGDSMDTRVDQAMALAAAQPGEK